MSEATLRGAAQRVLSGGAKVLGLRLLFLAFSFAIAALLARALPSAEMGTYFLCLSAAAFVALAMNLGLPGVAVREVGRWRARGDAQRAADISAGLLALSFRILLLQVAGGAALAGAAAAGWVGGEPRVLFLTALLAGATGVQVVQAEVFRGFGRIVAATLFGGLLAAFLTFCVLAACVLAGVQASASLALLVTIAGVAASVALGASQLPRHATRASPVPARALLGEGRAFWAMGIGAFVFFQADLWVAGWLLPLEQVALYGAAARLVQPLLLPVEATEAAIAPDIVALHASGTRGELGLLLLRAARLQLALVVAGALVLILGGGALLGLVFGPSYAAAHPVVAILAVGLCVRAACGAFGYLLVLTDHGRAIATLTIVGAAATLLVDSIAGWLAGMTGVALASAVMLSSFCLLGAAVARRLTGMPTGAARLARRWP